MRRALSVAAAAILLGGCAQLPPLNFSVPNTGPSKSPLDAEVKSITVQIARPDEQTGDIDWSFVDNDGGSSITSTWHTALQEALDRTLIFRDEGSKKVSIAVKVLMLDAPNVGFSMTTDAAARYEVIDRSNGDIIYTKDITSAGTTPADYDFLGIVRALESINRAVQNNITLFLQEAENIDMDRPMFPANPS